MFENVDWLPDNFVISDAVLSLLASSVILVITVMILRSLTARFIQRTVQSPELRGKWLINSRNGFLLLMLLGLVMIWGEELRTLALSIVAIAVAFVVATKELILCFTGSILKSGSRSFVLGDRIQVKDLQVHQAYPHGGGTDLARPRGWTAGAQEPDHLRGLCR